jgi:hypothetical protein
MKLSARTDIELPHETVFAAASDFAGTEARLAARGIEVRRTRDQTPPGPGIAWDARARLRGRMRDIHAELTVFAPPLHLAVLSRIGGMTSAFDLRLVALSAGRTRVIVGMDLRADTLRTKLLLQAMRLGKRQAEARLARALAVWAAGLADQDQRRRGSAG